MYYLILFRGVDDLLCWFLGEEWKKNTKRRWHQITRMEWAYCTSSWNQRMSARLCIRNVVNKHRLNISMKQRMIFFCRSSEWIFRFHCWSTQHAFNAKHPNKLIPFSITNFALFKNSKSFTTNLMFFCLFFLVFVVKMVEVQWVTHGRCNEKKRVLKKGRRI